jgi:opacity protein-like surface antigen
MRAGSFAASALLIGCALGLPQAAAAADYLRGSQIEGPVEAPTFVSDQINWSGFYFGGGAGVSDTKFKSGEGLADLVNYPFRNSITGAEADPGSWLSDIPEKHDSGATFFGFTGYNVLFGDVMLGFEADYTRSSHSYSIVEPPIARRVNLSDGSTRGITVSAEQGAKLNDYATARLRMGWAYGRIMPYATVGAAVGRLNTSSVAYVDNRFLFNPGLPTETSAQVAGFPQTVGGAKKNVYSFGLSAGLGLDWAVTDNLFLRGEYQLVRFAEVEGTTVTVNTARFAAGLKF